MTDPDRIGCLVPTCGRTFKKIHAGEYETVCGKHWKLLPKELKDEYKRLAARRRKFERRLRKRGVENADFPALTARQHENWAKIREFLLAPPKPQGLDAFLEENFK